MMAKKKRKYKVFAVMVKENKNSPYAHYGLLKARNKTEALRKFNMMNKIA
jgi:1,2-phenylacetyl-CoA epoxidase PaaB subunit